MENAGQIELKAAKTAEHVLIDKTTALVKALAKQGDDLGKRKRSYTVCVAKNGLHSPAKRLTYHDEELARAAAAEAEKTARAKERADQAKQKVEARLASTCAFVDCGVVSKGGSKWVRCENCTYLLCPAHKSSLVHHQCAPKI